ncbi:hypothetical protein [Serinicoccus chungangensis]|uniref:hypothetical protein n=1 Tax=Serinicoccus chungangensis TaxID=767452 RepID=UPI00111B13D2|nr:hypothetical protein [Serinicoccus chungangensis]
MSHSEMPPRSVRGGELATLLANAGLELSTCHDRLLARWAALARVEARLSPLHQRHEVAATPAGWVELSGRVAQDHQLCSTVLGQLYWACRVDSGTTGTPTLVTETLHAAITHAASLTSCLEAAAHTLRTAGDEPGGLAEAAAMCGRFLEAAQHDLDRVRADVAQAATLVPAPPPRWLLRAVV